MLSVIGMIESENWMWARGGEQPTSVRNAKSKLVPLDLNEIYGVKLGKSAQVEEVKTGEQVVHIEHNTGMSADAVNELEDKICVFKAAKEIVINAKNMYHQNKVEAIRYYKDNMSILLECNREDSQSEFRKLKSGIPLNRR